MNVFVKLEAYLQFCPDGVLLLFKCFMSCLGNLSLLQEEVRVAFILHPHSSCITSQQQLFVPHGAYDVTVEAKAR